MVPAIGQSRVAQAVSNAINFARNHTLRLLVAILTLMAIFSFSLAFIVKEGRAAVVTRFGDPIAIIENPGLHFKAPWPIDLASEVDLRNRILTTPKIELLTRDKKNIILMTSATWRPSDPLLFYRSVGTTQSADQKLSDLLANANIATFGKYDLSALVSTESSNLRVSEIESSTLSAVNNVARQRYGIEVLTVGFRRVSLPAQNTAFVLDQMRAERGRFAASFRAEGQLEASRIRNAADLEAAQILAEAEAEATRIRGEAEAEAARIYLAAHRKAPDFFRFQRSLESLERILGEDSSITLRTDAEPFSLLKSASGE